MFRALAASLLLLAPSIALGDDEAPPIVSRLVLLTEGLSLGWEELGIAFLEGRLLGLDTAFGRLEVALLSVDEQRRAATGAAAADVAPIDAAPAGTFDRNELPLGRVVIELPVATF